MQRGWQWWDRHAILDRVARVASRRADIWAEIQMKWGSKQCKVLGAEILWWITKALRQDNAGCVWKSARTSQAVLVVKNLPLNAGDPRDLGSAPGSGISSEVGKDTLLQYSCMENSMDSVGWWATVHGATKNWKRLSTHTHTRTHTHTHTHTQGQCNTHLIPGERAPSPHPVLSLCFRKPYISHTCTHIPQNDNYVAVSITQKLVICSGYHGTTCNFKQLPSLFALPRFQTIVSPYLWLCVLKAKSNCVQLQRFEFCWADTALVRLQWVRALRHGNTLAYKKDKSINF